jgi:hypothetical protein
MKIMQSVIVVITVSAIGLLLSADNVVASIFLAAISYGGLRLLVWGYERLGVDLYVTPIPRKRRSKNYRRIFSGDRVFVPQPR